jgi:flavin reductase (DIM6/NTAB) family NADH-FMN oxidoreductase RutF
MEEFAVADRSARDNARVIKSAVSPRPIAWISTRSEDGVDNLAPYSSYNYVSSDPPVVLFNSPDAEDGGPKDTARNALEREEFAVNVVTEPLLAAMDSSSERLPPEESEFDHVGVERAPCRRIDAPRVAEAAVTMECTLHDSLSVHGRLVILGDVEYLHVSEAVLTDGTIDMRKLPTVGRLGGPYYTVSDRVEFERQF